MEEPQSRSNSYRTLAAPLAQPSIGRVHATPGGLCQTPSQCVSLLSLKPGTLALGRLLLGSGLADKFDLRFWALQIGFV